MIVIAFIYINQYVCTCSYRLLSIRSTFVLHYPIAVRCVVALFLATSSDWMRFTTAICSISSSSLKHIHSARHRRTYSRCLTRIRVLFMRALLWVLKALQEKKIRNEYLTHFDRFFVFCIYRQLHLIRFIHFNRFSFLLENGLQIGIFMWHNSACDFMLRALFREQMVTF